MSAAPTRELIVTYYAYQQWANRRILETAATVTFEQLTISVLDGFDPVRSTMTHMMWAQLLWVRRFKGMSRAGDIDPAEFPDLATLEARWAEIDAETNAFLEELTEAQITGPLPPGRRKDESLPPMWQGMLHQANHQTYHRGEVAAVLTHLGASPGELDFNRMYDGRR